MEILPKLDAISRRIDEARAAAQVIADGDPSAMSELDAEVDAIARDVAELKGMTAGPPTGA
jgi:hypothetical protein